MAEQKGVFGGFKDFILRGNVVELAIAVVIGTAFTAVVKAVVADIITPLVGAIFGTHTTFGNLYFKLNHSKFAYGDVIDNIIAFLAVASVIYFLIVVPLNKLDERRKSGAPDPEITVRPCPECLTEIPKAATRCAACTAQVSAIV